MQNVCHTAIYPHSIHFETGEVRKSSSNTVSVPLFVSTPCINAMPWIAFSALMLLVGQQEGHPACKKLSGGMLVSVSVCVEVQICIWPSRCHCHSLSLAPVNPDCDNY